jgi:hypothetical protein
MWISMLLNQWRWILIGSLIFALALSTLYGRALRAEVAEKTAVIESMKNAEIEYSKRSEASAKEISDAYQSVLEHNQRQGIALKNARAKFGSCNVAGGITGSWLRAKDGVGEAYSAGDSDGAAEERVAVDRLFIDDCAADAARINAWRGWAVKNELPVQ